MRYVPHRRLGHRRPLEGPLHLRHRRAADLHRHEDDEQDGDLGLRDHEAVEEPGGSLGVHQVRDRAGGSVDLDGDRDAEPPDGDRPVRRRQGPGLEVRDLLQAVPDDAEQRPLDAFRREVGRGRAGADLGDRTDVAREPDGAAGVHEARRPVEVDAEVETLLSPSPARTRIRCGARRTRRGDRTTIRGWTAVDSTGSLRLPAASRRRDPYAGLPAGIREAIAEQGPREARAAPARGPLGLPLHLDLARRLRPLVPLPARRRPLLLVHHRTTCSRRRSGSACRTTRR